MKNLVLEGGGVKGVAYAGVLKGLQDVGQLDSVENILGVSAGSIAALLLAIGMTPKECSEALFSINFNDFKDNSFGFVRDGFRFVRRYGLNRGEVFSSWLSDVVYAYTGNKNLTFSQLHNRTGSRTLYIGTCCLNTATLEILSHETTPDLSVVKAVRMSMSIPFFYVPVLHEGKYYVDGGLLNNFPINFFDSTFPPEETLGIKLDNSDLILDRSFNYEIDNLAQYSTALFRAVYDNLQAGHMSKKDWNRTLVIDCYDVEATNFKISESDKYKLIQAGWITTLRRFSKNL